MSRVGKLPIRLAAGVKVEIKGDVVKVEGPKGKLSHTLPAGIAVKVDNGQVVVTKKAEDKKTQALFGTTRAVLANLVHGAASGFTRELDIVGVGYRAAVKGNTLSMTLGYSHSVDYDLPAGVSAKVDNNTHITLTGSDKVLLGMVAAKIRSFREPEPYQGKGVKYANERIIRKEGKAAGGK